MQFTKNVSANQSGTSFYNTASAGIRSVSNKKRKPAKYNVKGSLKSNASEKINFIKPEYTIDELGIDKYQELATSIEDYLIRNGAEAFLDEIYNIYGNKASITITNKNKQLAAALGIFIKNNSETNFTEQLEKTYYGYRTFNDNRIIEFQDIAQLFKERRVGQNLPEHQMFFLRWYFKAGSWFQRNLIDNDDGVVAWNSAIVASNNRDFTLYTFGLIGCTAVMAEGADGSFYFAHTEGDGIGAENHLSRIKKDIIVFSKDRKIAKILTYGVYAKNWAVFLRNTFPNSKNIVYSIKTGDLFSSVASIRVKKHLGVLKYECMIEPLDNKYMASLYPNTNLFNDAFKKKGLLPDFGYAGGITSHIFPSDHLTFDPIIFSQLGL